MLDCIFNINVFYFVKQLLNLCFIYSLPVFQIGPFSFIYNRSGAVCTLGIISIKAKKITVHCSEHNRNVGAVKQFTCNTIKTITETGSMNGKGLWQDGKIFF